MKILKHIRPVPCLKKRVILPAVVLLLLNLQVQAHQFPVQVTPQVLPPYSLQLSDYYSPAASGSKLNILLLLRDFNRSSLTVRLRMSIEGPGLSIRSREDVVYVPVTLDPGVPLYLDPSQLAQYFTPDNLLFSGITRQQYEQTGKLPEGFYTFCFEAVETITNQTVSDKSCSFAWLTLNEPPMLNIPRRAEGIKPATPQNLIFQWTPRHTASPTAAFNTDYIFYLAELNDNSIAPEAAFLSNPTLFVDSVNTTTYLYDMNKPPLIPGKKYAWRIQAKAKNGLDDLAMFRNGGYSETYWFTYQDDCPAPVGESAVPQGQRVNISWSDNPRHLEYKVEYREKNNPDAMWFEMGNTLPRVALGDLKPGMQYEYRAGGACDYGRFTFSDLLTFTSNGSNATTVAQCGTFLTIPAGAGSLTTLNPGDIVKAGDFEMVTIRASGQGNFSGDGYVKVSWLADMKLAVRFTNITVGTDYKLKDGALETTYDPTEGGIVDVGEAIQDIKDMAGIINGLLQITINSDYKYFERLKDAFQNIIDAEVDDAMKNEFNQLIDALDTYKNEYDAAKNEFENLPDGPEKDTAKQRMETAEQNFNSTKEQLQSLNEEKEQLVTEVTDLFISSVKELKEETNTNYSNAPAEFETKKQEIIGEVYSGQGLSENSTSPTDPDFLYKGSFEEVITDDQVPTELRTFADKLKVYSQKKKNYKLLKYIKALEKYYIQENKRESLKDDTILESVTMIKEIIARRKNNEPDDAVKAFIKTYITQKVSGL